jgi:HlyD family secretion protein
MNDAAPPSSAIKRNLELASSKRRRWIARIVGLLAVAVAVAAVILWRARAGADEGPRYVSEQVERGDLRVTVSATGTVKGRDTVEVGAEISGRIKVVHVDFNDHVKKDQVLAEIDTEQLQAGVEQASAQLRRAQAEVVSAKAAAKEAKLQLERSREMAREGLVSRQQLETAEAAAERTDASVGAAQASATVSAASLKEVQTAFGKAEIRSPIDGVVLARHIEAGQTVAASLQAPILFTIARDLKEMVLSVDVDEADIGKVTEGQSASFTVDAFPGRTFRAKVESVRNVPKTDQQVVTYEAVLAVDNDDLALRPGMTATATIVTAQKKGVLLVPNAALRFTPPDQLKEDSSRGIRVPGMRGPRIGGGRPGGSASASASGSPPQGRGRGQRERVWTLAGKEPAAVVLATGATDGRFTEVLESRLEEGTAVLVDVEAEEK